MARLNLVLRGWGDYFRYGNSSRQFSAVDSYVRMRLAQLASTKHGRRGRNWTTRYNYAWSTRLGVAWSEPSAQGLRMPREVEVRRQVKLLSGRRLVFAPPKRGKARTGPLPEVVAVALAEHIRRFPPVEVMPWTGREAGR